MVGAAQETVIWELWIPMAVSSEGKTRSYVTDQVAAPETET